MQLPDRDFSADTKVAGSGEYIIVELAVDERGGSFGVGNVESVGDVILITSGIIADKNVRRTDADLAGIIADVSVVITGAVLCTGITPDKVIVGTGGVVEARSISDEVVVLTGFVPFTGVKSHKGVFITGGETVTGLITKGRVALSAPGVPSI